MARYQYETSPRKVRPNVAPRRKTREEERQEEFRKKIELENRKQKRNYLKQEKRRHYKNIGIIIGMFLLLLTISYRNSLITERFNQIQSKKKELSEMVKINEQAQVNIESNINLQNVEEVAKDKLGMQKLEKDQKVYVNINKEDYTESGTEDIIKEETDSNWFTRIISNIFK